VSIIMQDPVRLEAPARSPVRPPPGSAAPSMRGKLCFELESRGGYRRTVVGTLAYLDEEAQTYLVRATGGDLFRVPLRDIRKTTRVLPERQGAMRPMSDRD
jgi:hypothetical protein